MALNHQADEKRNPNTSGLFLGAVLLVTKRSQGWAHQLQYINARKYAERVTVNRDSLFPYWYSE